MRAFILLCLVHVAVTRFSWDPPTTAPQKVAAPINNLMCLADRSSCGCCLMQTHIQRMEMFFNSSIEGINLQITGVKRLFNNVRASRSAFSVALNNDNNFNCYGPFTNDVLIIYKHIFLNLGQGYDAQTGMFTVPRNGVYSLSVTTYASHFFGNTQSSCANLHVNGMVVASVLDQNGQDSEDSGTAVVTLKLRAGDQVSVSLPQGCAVCDHYSRNYFNTFTGFLLYSTN